MIEMSIIFIVVAMIWMSIGSGIVFEIMWKDVYNWKSILVIILSGPFGWLMGLCALLTIVMDKIHVWISKKG